MLCDRGTNVLVNKVAEAQRAHAVGIIIGDVTQPDIVSLSVPLPTVSVHVDGRTKILDYINQPGAAKATLVAGNKTSTKSDPVPQVAGFSSRGPSQINADVLKPDVAAPGVGRARRRGAAVEQPVRTSTSTTARRWPRPHIAGLAAWELSKRPKLSPGELRSMFMTTAHDTVTADGHKSKDAFAQGAGQVTPRRLNDPGLVFPAGIEDWLGWLEGQGIDTGSGVPGDPGLRPERAFHQGLVAGVLDHADPQGEERLGSRRDLHRVVRRVDSGVAVSFETERRRSSRTASVRDRRRASR